MWPHSNNFLDSVQPDTPAEFLRYTCATDSFEEFLRSGFETASMFNLALNKFAGRTADSFHSVLDFGSGCGRLARYMKPAGQLFGCDVHPTLYAFCNERFGYGSFYRNALMPPLIYRDGLFDLVYSFSVFSHLSREVEDAWLAELARVGAPGCVYLMTVHGDWMIEKTLGEETQAAIDAGFYYRHVHERQKTQNDFPDYYESSYHTSEYIHATWAEHFEIITIVKGDNPARLLTSEQAFVPEGDVPRLRPMGQDLVVARKRA